MKKSTPKGSRRKSTKSKVTSYVIATIAAGVLVGGSFALASGSLIQSGNSLLASVAVAITGKPTVMIGRDASSPSGNIQMGSYDALAIFDISARNVTHWATVNYVPIQIAIRAAPSSPLTLSNIRITYNYCIPPGTLYGYGYRSSGCANVQLFPNSVTQNGSTYMLTLPGGIPIYPEESSGTFTVYATPSYAFTGNATRPQSGNANLQVTITTVSASGDQCQWTWIPSSASYGYANCVAAGAIINIWSGQGNVLTVIRPYGYGYGYRKVHTSPLSSLDTCSTTPTVECLQNELQQLVAIINQLLSGNR
jgi:hypothetical protein